MRIVLFAAVFLASCAPQKPLTAQTYLEAFQPRFRAPSPAAIVEGLNLPLRAGDKVMANCAEFFAEDLPEMAAEDRREFEKSVTCIYPPKGESQASAAFYNAALRERGFQDESGTYVQSGMRILCNRTHSLAIRFKAKFAPRSVMNAKGEEIDIPGGGALGHETLMLMATPEPCERYALDAQFQEPPAPENYIASPQPNFVPPDLARVRWGDYELPLRAGDRLVSHCAQYYREELNKGADAPAGEFARYNQQNFCIYPQGALKDAAAHYLKVLSDAGFSKDSPWAAPHPESMAPESRAGVYEWGGLVSRCAQGKSFTLRALARYGRMKLLDPLTGEVWSTKQFNGGREAPLPGADAPNPILILNFVSLGC